MAKRNLIGHILVDLGHVCMAHVNEAIREQTASSPGLKIGEILIQMNAINPEQLERGVQLQEMERLVEQPAEVEEMGR